MTPRSPWARAPRRIAFNFLLVPRWGIEGAAVAYAIGMVVWNVWTTIPLYRKTGIHGTVYGRSFSSNAAATAKREWKS
jgi:O-antigen/teichoic acid export membrane protein